jgi:thiol-disulfide isomerase/thioredoxin
MLLAAVVANAQTTVPVTVSLTGWDGHPLRSGHVAMQAQPWSGNENGRFDAVTDVKGQCTLNLPAGLYTIVCTGLNNRRSERRHLFVSAYSQPVQPQSISVRLDVPTYLLHNPNRLSLRIRKDDPKDRTDVLKPLQYLGRFRYAADITCDAPRALLCVEGFGNGTDAAPPGMDKYVDDGTGKYFGVLTMNTPKKHIEIDLAKLPGYLEHARVDPGEQWTGQVLLHPIAQAADFVDPDTTGSSRPELFWRDLKAARRACREAVLSSHSDTQPARMVEFCFQLNELGSVPPDSEDVEILNSMMQIVPPDAPWWTLVQTQDVLFRADTARAADYLLRIIAQHPNESIVARTAKTLVGMYVHRNAAGDSALASDVLTKAVRRIVDPRLSIDLKSSFPEIEWESGETQSPGGEVILIPDEMRQKAPEFRVPSLDGRQLLTRQRFNDHVTVIDFWATWCAPCLAEMKPLHELFKTFGPQGLDIVSMSFDNSPDVVKRFRSRRYPMPWLHGYVAQGFSSDISRAFNMEGLPWVVLLDNHGRVAYSGADLRGDALSKAVRQLVAEKKVK